jgi:fatty-acyl-CoA synthase
LTTDHDAHLGRVHEDGFTYVLGRSNDLIIRGGHTIDPVVIEHALLAHPEVTGANAVGRPDPCSGEAPVAYVTVRAGSTGTGRTIRDWVSGRMSERAATPTEVTIVDALPVTAVGKTNKAALRADATAREVRSALINAGISIADDSVVCVPTTRSLDVVVRGPDNQHLRAAIRVVLERYPLRWRFSQAQR